MDQAIEDRVGQSGVANDGMPVVCEQLTRHERRVLYLYDLVSQFEF